MATLSGMIRANKAAAAKEAAQQKRTEKEPRSLTSDAGLSTPEPATRTGMRANPAAKRSEPKYEHSVSGGRHHGLVMNIADAASHTIENIAHEGTLAANTISDARSAIGQSYEHLAKHHTHYLQGNHEMAAVHLQKAAETIKYSMNKVGGAGRLIETPHGEKHRRGDLQATLNHAVSHFATTHSVNLQGVEAPRLSRQRGKAGELPQGKADKPLPAFPAKQDSMGRTETHVLGGQQLAEYHRRLEERGGAREVSAGFEALNRSKPGMTRRDHVMQAHNDLINKGKIHPRQLAALSSKDIDDLHEITGVQKPYEPKTSFPSETPMPKDREK